MEKITDNRNTKSNISDCGTRGQEVPECKRQCVKNISSEAGDPPKGSKPASEVLVGHIVEL